MSSDTAGQVNGASGNVSAPSIDDVEGNLKSLLSDRLQNGAYSDLGTEQDPLTPESSPAEEEKAAETPSNDGTAKDPETSLLDSTEPAESAGAESSPEPSSDPKTEPQDQPVMVDKRSLDKERIRRKQYAEENQTLKQ
jgi:hypothetical protein